ncbi:MAG: dTDP-4-dehydrorhamnose 3,5-epimerase family protein [Planctomycetota bacterium]
MIFSKTTIPGAYRIDIDPIEDERGSFARTWCKKTLASLDLETDVEQSSVSYNRALGTLRGMHYQAPPAAETKIVGCSRGAIYDVILDLRVDSPTFLQWEAFTLTAANHAQLYIPEGVAHGFQTLEAGSEVSYQISTAYAPDRSFGFRHDDPAFGIEWPIPVSAISERDQNHPTFSVKRLETQWETIA